jgi:hypothetical protein
MLAPLNLRSIALAARSLHRIDNAQGIEVACVRGATWITQERDGRDIVLSAGESLVLDRPGVAIAYALQDAMITLGEPHPLGAATAEAPLRAPAERARA